MFGDLKRQLKSRMTLLEEMMASGAVCTPVEFLEKPAMLVMHMSDRALRMEHKELMRTRRRERVFGLNGRSYLLTRKLAILVVRAEMSQRGMMANVELTGLRRPYGEGPVQRRVGGGDE